jgi:hypothetical protein
VRKITCLEKFKTLCNEFLMFSKRDYIIAILNIATLNLENETLIVHFSRSDSVNCPLLGSFSPFCVLISLVKTLFTLCVLSSSWRVICNCLFPIFLYIVLDRELWDELLHLQFFTQAKFILTDHPSLYQNVRPLDEWCILMCKIRINVTVPAADTSKLTTLAKNAFLIARKKDNYFGGRFNCSLRRVELIELSKYLTCFVA